MNPTRTDLEKKLNALEGALPAVSSENPDPADFWPAFAGMADAIVDTASAEDVEWAQDRIEDMLARLGPPRETG